MKEIMARFSYTFLLHVVLASHVQIAVNLVGQDKEMKLKGAEFS